MCQRNRQKIKMYTKLPTYKIVVADQYSRNLELLSHLPVVVCTSQAKSLQLLVTPQNFEFWNVTKIL
jgi:hypothetical protein